MQLKLISHIRTLVDLSVDEEQIIRRFSQSRVIRKGDHLLSSGTVSEALYFVEKGSLRMYFLNHKFAEQITHYAHDGMWMTDLLSFTNNEPSDYFIQAIEDSIVTSIDVHVFEDLLKELPHMERYFRFVFQKDLATYQVRVKYLHET